MDHVDVSRLISALHYSADQHRDQRRKDADETPYINHPISLLSILNVEAGITDPDVLIASVLHDVIEDCSGPLQEDIELRRVEIRTLFGESVLLLVDGVTDDKSLAKDVRKQRQIEKSPHLPLGAKLVKLADKIANLRDIVATPPASWSVQRRNAYFTWAAQVVAALRGSNKKLEELFDQAYSAMAELEVSPNPADGLTTGQG